MRRLLIAMSLLALVSCRSNPSTSVPINTIDSAHVTMIIGIELHDFANRVEYGSLRAAWTSDLDGETGWQELTPLNNAIGDVHVELNQVSYPAIIRIWGVSNNPRSWPAPERRCIVEYDDESGFQFTDLFRGEEGVWRPLR